MISDVFRISKRGPNIRWPLVLTQRGSQTKFSNFFTMSNKFFLAKRGPWPNGPPKYATGSDVTKESDVGRMHPFSLKTLHIVDKQVYDFISSTCTIHSKSTL